MSATTSNKKKSGASASDPAASGFVEIRRRGLMLVLSSPSGAGKTSISRALLARDSLLEMSVSATTRPKRPGEVPGIDYLFVDAEEFNLMVNREEFLEYAKVFGNYYGTPRAPVGPRGKAAMSQSKRSPISSRKRGTSQIPVTYIAIRPCANRSCALTPDAASSVREGETSYL